MSETSYRVVWRTDPRVETTRFGVHCPGPFTRIQAFTVLGKISKQYRRLDYIEPIPADEMPEVAPDLYINAQKMQP